MFLQSQGPPETAILSYYSGLLVCIIMIYSLILSETLQSPAIPWCNDGGTAEVNDVMLLHRPHDAQVHVPPMGASNPVWYTMS